MFLDKENIFSLEQAVTATAVSTNIVDLGKGDTGNSDRPHLTVTATTPYGGTGTMNVEVQTSDVEAFTGPVVVASYPVPNDKLKAGGHIVGTSLPQGVKRYVRLNYAVSGTISAGKLTAGLALDTQYA